MIVEGGKEDERFGLISVFVVCALNLFALQSPKS